MMGELDHAAANGLQRRPIPMYAASPMTPPPLILLAMQSAGSAEQCAISRRQVIEKRRQCAGRGDFPR